MRTLAERRKVLSSICELAKRGHKDAIKFLSEYGHCKVYTYEEIALLNSHGVTDFTVENLLGGINDEDFKKHEEDSIKKKES